MDFKSVKAQIESSRRTTVAVGGITFSLILPSEHALRVAYEANRSGDRVLQSQALRPLLERAITGWEGATVGHLVPEPESAAETLPFSAEALSELLEHRQDIADGIQLDVFAQMKVRQEKLRDAEKN